MYSLIYFAHASGSSVLSFLNGISISNIPCMESVYCAFMIRVPSFHVCSKILRNAQSASTSSFNLSTMAWCDSASLVALISEGNSSSCVVLGLLISGSPACCSPFSVGSFVPSLIFSPGTSKGISVELHAASYPSCANVWDKDNVKVSISGFSLTYSLVLPISFRRVLTTERINTCRRVVGLSGSVRI